MADFIESEHHDLGDAVSWESTAEDKSMVEAQEQLFPYCKLLGGRKCLFKVVPFSGWKPRNALSRLFYIEKLLFPCFGAICATRHQKHFYDSVEIAFGLY